MAGRSGCGTPGNPPSAATHCGPAGRTFRGPDDKPGRDSAYSIAPAVRCPAWSGRSSSRSRRQSKAPNCRASDAVDDRTAPAASSMARQYPQSYGTSDKRSAQAVDRRPRGKQRNPASPPDEFDAKRVALSVPDIPRKSQSTRLRFAISVCNSLATASCRHRPKSACCHRAGSAVRPDVPTHRGYREPPSSP